MLLDTSGLLRLHNRREPGHEEAWEFFQAATGQLTHSYVLAELIAVATSRRMDREPLLDFIAGIQDEPSLDTIFVDEELHRRAMELLRARLDKTWSLCDAVSFILMQQHRLTEALTTDHHFEQAGFVRLLEP
jgi:predicted nucleic acid-binding protein